MARVTPFKKYHLCKPIVIVRSLYDFFLINADGDEAISIVAVGFYANQDRDFVVVPVKK